jgi:hypothetical protein
MPRSVKKPIGTSAVIAAEGGWRRLAVGGLVVR